MHTLAVCIMYRDSISIVHCILHTRDVCECLHCRKCKSMLLIVIQCWTITKFFFSFSSIGGVRTLLNSRRYLNSIKFNKNQFFSSRSRRRTICDTPHWLTLLNWWCGADKIIFRILIFERAKKTDREICISIIFILFFCVFKWEIKKASLK